MSILHNFLVTLDSNFLGKYIKSSHQAKIQFKAQQELQIKTGFQNYHFCPSLKVVQLVSHKENRMTGKISVGNDENNLFCLGCLMEELILQK